MFVEHSKTGPGLLAHKDEMERAKIFEEACMEPVNYDILDNKLWYNPYFPMPACLGKYSSMRSLFFFIVSPNQSHRVYVCMCACVKRAKRSRGWTFEIINC